MLAARCPHCLHAWSVSQPVDRLTCPVCGGAGTVKLAGAETGHSLSLPSSGTTDGAQPPLAADSGPPAFLAAPQAPDELGRLGRYRVLRALGAGGMGAVYEAEDTQLHRRVALKVMHPETAARPSGRARFLREAAAVATLEHDHIVAVYDAGEQNGAPFLVMPLLKGEPLEARLKRQNKRPLPLREALRVAAEMAEGLAAAHEKGLIHRDVKPANVWLEAGTGRAKLLDFGLARLAEDDSAVTKTGAVLGTPAYMAPEQAAGRKKGIDARADLFSLGAVLYEMLTGRRAFPGEDWMEVLAARATRALPAPRRVNAAVPEEVSRLVMRLLEKDAARRPASAREVAARLRAVTAPAPTQEKAPAGTTSGRGGRRWPVAVAAVGLLLALGWALWPRARKPEPGPAPQGDEPRPAAGGATTFAAAWHDAARGHLADRAARREAAALAFGEGLHTAATARLLALREAELQAEKARLEAVARRQGQREAAAAALAFGGALHEASAAVPGGGRDGSFVNSLGLKMIRIKPGRFLRGAPDSDRDAVPEDKPQHEAQISKAFYLAEATVTVGQFRRFVREAKYTPESVRDGQGGFGFNEQTGKREGRDPKYGWLNTGWKQTDDHPVVNVTWGDAVAFCKWLSDREKTEYRLPTGAEWEYACRAGTETHYFTGDDVASLHGFANLADAALKRKIGANFPGLVVVGFDDGHVFTAPVKSFRPNPWGLFDMHGNVWQWCADGRGKYDKRPVTDPVEVEIGKHAFRGGSWSSPAADCRSAYRYSYADGSRGSTIGFRVACSAPR
jgi:formylglycine-generating enzyme required for sulfatase activity/tRNA A-37 threonylcarbamoyl transferase component Bud32